MDSKEKTAPGDNSKEAIWVVGVLCGIVLVILLVFSVRRRTELIQADQKIEELTSANQSLSDENAELNKEIDKLQKQLDEAEKKNEELKEKADAYDSAQEQIRDFMEKLESLFPDAESTPEQS